MNLTADQRAAIEHPVGNVLLAASAGSGKTEVLARRCAALVDGTCDSSEVTRLLVVTFTRAAAAELRQRVGRMLRQAAAAVPRGSAREWLLRQETLLPSAEIGTIDAWCQRLVRENFIEAGVDARFTVLPAQDAVILRERTMDELFDWVFTAPDATADAAREWLRRAGRASHEFLRGHVATLHQFREQLVDPAGWLRAARAAHTAPAAALRAWVTRLLADDLAALLRSAIAGAGGQPWRDEPRVAALCSRYERLAAQLEGDGNPWPAAEEISALKPTLPKDASRWRSGAVTKVRAAADPAYLRARIDDAPAVCALVVTLLDLEAAFSERLAAAKRQRNAYSFGDILRMALQLLGRPEPDGTWTATPLAVALQSHYRHVLIDEYQDTSPVQVRLLNLVSNGNQFAVGDVKQSIYGFRAAAPELFARQRDAYEADGGAGTTRYLADNFRSDARLLDGLNALFGRLFRAEFGGSPFGPREQLVAGRAPETGSDAADAARIELWLVQRDTRAVNADDAGDDDVLRERVEREALLAAAEIRRLRVASGGGLRWADCVILLRAAEKNAALVAAALRAAGLPAAALGRESLLDSIEVQDIRGLLALLGNLQDDGALAAYLRGPFVGLDEPTLARIRACAPGPYHAAVRAASRAPTADGAAVRAALDQLARLRRAARSEELPAVLERIYRAGALPQFALGLQGGTHRTAMLRALQRFAEQSAADSALGAADFAAYLDALAAAQAAPDVAAAVTGDVVRVMTVHAAKGLEFPVVFLLNAGAAINEMDARGPLSLDAQAGIGLRFADFPAQRDRMSPAREAVMRAVQRRNREEELRLLYVAATRARERLYIVGSAKAPPDEALVTQVLQRPDSATRVLEWVWAAAQGGAQQDARGPLLRTRIFTEAETATPETTPALPAADAPDSELTREDAALVDAAAALLRAPQQQQRFASLVPAVISVSALKRPAPPDEAAPGPAGGLTGGALGTPRFAAAKATDGRARGTAVHRFLERADLSRLTDAQQVRAQLDEMSRAGLLAAADAAAVSPDDVAWFAGTPLGALAARHAAVAEREWSFVQALPVGRSGDRVLVRGVVDLLLPTPEWVLIDFKTDRASERELERRLDGYRTQLRLYARAVAAILGTVRAAELVLLDARRIVSVDCRDLDSWDPAAALLPSAVRPG